MGSDVPFSLGICVPTLKGNLHTKELIALENNLWCAYFVGFLNISTDTMIIYKQVPLR